MTLPTVKAKSKFALCFPRLARGCESGGRAAVLPASDNEITFAPCRLFVPLGSPRGAPAMATFRIEQTEKRSTLLKDDRPIMAIEHDDVGQARDKVKMVLIDEAQEQTRPGDVLELAEGALH